MTNCDTSDCLQCGGEDHSCDDIITTNDQIRTVVTNAAVPYSDIEHDTMYNMLVVLRVYYLDLIKGNSPSLTTEVTNAMDLKKYNIIYNDAWQDPTKNLYILINTVIDLIKKYKPITTGKKIRLQRLTPGTISITNVAIYRKGGALIQNADITVTNKENNITNQVALFTKGNTTPFTSSEWILFDINTNALDNAKLIKIDLITNTSLSGINILVSDNSNKLITEELVNTVETAISYILYDKLSTYNISLNAFISAYSCKQPETSNTKLGGPSITNSCCKCDSGMVWGVSGCTTLLQVSGSCPPGTSNSNTGDDSSVANCKCPVDHWWINNKCVKCPPGSNKYVSDSRTNVTGCYCPAPSVWYNYSCVTCPSGTSVTNTGEPVNPPICKCPEGTNRFNNECIKCPMGTNVYNTGPVANVGNCRCPGGSINIGIGKCGQWCPGDQISATSVAAGVQAGGRINRDCYCPVGKGWDPGFQRCVTCADYMGYLQPPPDMSQSVLDFIPLPGIIPNLVNLIVGLTEPPVMIPALPALGSDVGIMGCACDKDQLWDVFNNICKSCPIGATTDMNFNPIPGFPGCYCSTGKIWDSYNVQCVDSANGCPIGSTVGKSVPTANAAGSYIGCFCESGKLWNEDTLSCEGPPCPFGALPTNTGERVPTTSCSCLPNQYFDINPPGCFNCPSTSTYGGAGKPHNVHPQCRCPVNKGWDSSFTECISYEDDGCPTGSSKTGLGKSIGDLNNTCFCNNTGELWNGKRCIPQLACPGDTTTIISGSYGGVSIEGCSCNSGYGFDTATKKCNLCSTYKYPGDVSGANPYGVRGCRCQPNEVWDGSSCKTCPINSAYGETGNPINIPGCNCIINTYSGDNVSCQTCPLSSSYWYTGEDAGIGYYGPSNCKCPPGQQWSDILERCIPPCPGGSVPTQWQGYDNPVNRPDCECPFDPSANLHGYWDYAINACV